MPNRSLRIAALLLALAIVINAQGACAQTTPSSSPSLPDPKNCYDYGFQLGTLLPANFGVREMVPGWGARTAVPTKSGVFEGSVFSGLGNGIMYRTVTIDYRLDLELEGISSHFLLGFHADQYSTESPIPASSRFSGGWHYGGGVTQWLAGPIYARFDFRHRFSPGQIVEVTVGLIYRLPSANSGG